jgi:hydroxybutyrate-dimer hydrolase
MNAVAGFRVCALAIAEIFALLQPCGGTDKVALAQLPAGVTQHSVTIYPATTVGMGVNASEQDLLTAGLGRSGLGSLSAPTYADAANPTVAELRRNAIYANYRAILDSSANGGYGQRR